MMINGFTSLPEKAVKNMLVFDDNVGNDQRTKDKYFDLMHKYGYVEIANLDDFVQNHKELLYKVPDDIETKKPLTPSENLARLRAQALGLPVPEQKKLGD